MTNEGKGISNYLQIKSTKMWKVRWQVILSLYRCLMGAQYYNTSAILVGLQSLGPISANERRTMPLGSYYNSV